MSRKILIVTGDGGDSYEALYAYHRFLESGQGFPEPINGLQGKGKIALDPEVARRDFRGALELVNGHFGPGSLMG